MNAEERIDMLKQIPPQSNFEKKQKIRTAIVLTLATFISLMFLIYAFMQKQESDRQAEIAIAAKEEAMAARQEAEKMKLVAEYSRMEADKQRALAEEALLNCEKSKKK